jgi:signal transduction histidine kinase
MKKITISVALLASVLTLKAQDTTCTYFTGKKVIEFDYKMDTILNRTEQTTKFFEIKVGYGNVLCLDLSDEKNRVRKVITTFFDGETITQVLDSKNSVYYSPKGTSKVSVGKPRLAIKL